jgi:hypothetical protein
MQKALGVKYGITQQFNYCPRDLPCKTEAKNGEEKVDSAMREKKKGDDTLNRPCPTLQSEVIMTGKGKGVGNQHENRAGAGGQRRH